MARKKKPSKELAEKYGVFPTVDPEVQRIWDIDAKINSKKKKSKSSFYDDFF